MKTCRGCGRAKPLDDFARDNWKKDGRGSYCKPCKAARHRAWVKKDRIKRPEYYREMDRAHYARHANKLAEKSRRRRQMASEEQREAKRERERARRQTPEWKEQRRLYLIQNCDERRMRKRVEKAVATAKYKGDLVKPARCECCGVSTEDLHAHHEDYRKALDVIWLDASCHQFWHAERKRLGLHDPVSTLRKEEKGD